MISTFAASNHFRTYLGERNPSFSANAHALQALALSGRGTGDQSVQLLVTFLANEWWKCGGPPIDKWVNLYVHACDISLQELLMDDLEQIIVLLSTRSSERIQCLFAAP